MSAPPKKYVCGYCARAFTRSEHKQRHERSHTNEKPFHCSYCTSAFVRRDLLQRHCRTVHNIRLASRAHSRPRVSKGGSVVSLENTWEPKVVPEVSANLHPNPAADDISPPPAHGTHEVSPKISPDLQQDALSTSYSSVSPPKVQLSSPTTRISPLEDQPSPAVKTEGQTPRISHAYPGPAHTAANLPGPHCLSPGLDPEPNIVASAKALLQLAPNNSSADILQISPGHGLGAPFDPSLASSSLDVLQVISLSKTLQQSYFTEDLKHPLDNFFFIGYSIIVKKPYNILPTSGADIGSYDSIFSQGQPLSFKVGLVYTILAVGCLSSAVKYAHYEKLAGEFIDKARNSLIEKSVSSQNTPSNQFKLLGVLYLFTSVYMSHFKNDSILAALENATYSTVQSLPQSVTESELDLLWKIYVLVSDSKPFGEPPKFYAWFVKQKLNGSLLIDTMRALSNPHAFPIAGMASQVVISTIANELKLMTKQERLLIYPSQLELHAALGSINRLANNGPNSDIFEILKRKLIIEAPMPSKDLLENSVFEITNASQITLLCATLRELDVTLDFHQFLSQNVNSSFQVFVENLRGFFQTENNYFTRLNGNFGLVSFPLIFNETFLGLKSAPSSTSQMSLNTFEKSNLDVFILQWYTFFVKTLVKVAANNHAVPVTQAFAKNHVFSSLLTILRERGKENFETGFDSIIPIFDEITRVCGSWIQHKSYLAKFQQNLFHFCRELLVLTLNQGRFNMEDVYASNDSLLIRNHRSKSIGSIETVLHPIEGGPRYFHAPPAMTPAFPYNVFAKNYVLKGEPATFPISPVQKNTAQYSPLGIPAATVGTGFANVDIPTILPPLHASLRNGAQPHIDNLKSE